MTAEMWKPQSPTSPAKINPELTQGFVTGLVLYRHSLEHQERAGSAAEQEGESSPYVKSKSHLEL